MARVKVQDGVLEGEIVDSDYGDKFYSFKGIPYAEPPIGDLKFKAPKPIKPWDGVRSAKESGSDCYQYDSFNNGALSGSEDCLYLNVYSPNITPEAPLPVMVFIHGGAFKTGSGKDILYGPEFLIRHDVILVTLNYRLGLLGFLCLDTEDVPGNAGMKDQVLALKWVKSNIEYFGGDPNNITIFGESAGAASVSFHLVSPMTKGLFNKAIVQSGTLLNFWATTFEAREGAEILARRLGFYSDDDKELYEFFKNLPIEKLLLDDVSVTLARKLYELNFCIVSEKQFGDNEVFFHGDKYDILRKGIHEGVDVITGYTEDEGLLAFAASVIRGTLSDLYNAADNSIEFFVPKQLTVDLPLKQQFEIGRRLKKHYLKNCLGSKNNVHCLLRYLNFDFFVYELITWAKFCANCSKSTVYLYKFTCKSERNQFAKYLKLDNVIPDRTVVCHADDLAYMFPLKSLNLKLDQNSLKSINNVTKLWTNFAKYGNPTPDESLGVKWQPFDLDQENYLEIGNELKSCSAPEKEDLELWDDIFRKYLPASKRPDSV